MLKVIFEVITYNDIKNKKNNKKNIQNTTLDKTKNEVSTFIIIF